MDDQPADPFITILSPEAWDRFLATLIDPPEPNEALRRLMAEAPPWNAAP